MNANGKVSEFQLGLDDSSGLLQIPQKLYGRSEEIQTLLSAFDRISRGASELLLVSGYSGVGKSALVHEVHKPITEKKGLFISGKFDQFQRDIPYYAIRYALKDLCEYLVTEDEEVLQTWKTTIISALDSNARVLIDIVPELSLILGDQPEVPELSAQESSNRLNYVFQNFIRAVSNQDHPLVIFIDDLQWADSGSLNLIKTLLSNAEEKYFLLIGAFRENEVDGAHAFSLALDEIRKSGSTIHSINLNSLKNEDVKSLTTDSLGSADSKKIAPLSDLIYLKTGGNAFFVTEFLKNLYEEKLIHFDFSKKEWVWDIATIQAKNVTSNVVELMAEKIERMPEETRKILQLGSCVGGMFSLKIISIIHEKNEKDTLVDLWRAVEEGLILPLDNNYKMFQGTSEREKIKPESPEQKVDFQNSENELLHDVNFQFLHDKVQEAAYLGIGEDRKKKVHLTIGRLLIESTEPEELLERIFSIVNQFNLGSELISEEKERLKLCELNLFAGRKAKHSTAYNSAITFFREGISLLPVNHWKNRYELSFELYSEKASCEFSAALLEDCESDVKIALENAVGQDDKTKIYQIYLNLLYQLNRHRDGINIGTEALRYLGVKIPKNATKAHIAVLYLKFRIRLGMRKPKDLIDLPEITDKRVFNICAIIFDMVPSAYQVFPDLMGYISLLMATYCLKYGNSIYSGFAYAMSAIIMSGVIKELETGFKFAELAESLAEKYYDLGVKARVHFAMGNFNIHWILPMREHKRYVDTAFKSALEVGTINWADYSMTFSRIQSIFFTDKTLGSILEENERIYEIYIKHKDREVILNQCYILNFLNSLSLSDIPISNPFHYNEADYAKEMQTQGNYTIRMYYYTLEMIRNFMSENWESALGFGWKGFKIVLEVLGTMLDFELRYYFVLSCLSFQISSKKSLDLKFKLAYVLNRFLIRYYSKKNPDNFLAHDCLISALEAQLAGDIGRASIHFEKAVQESHKAGFTINEALANEYTAKFYIENGIEKAAVAYMTEAAYIYATWGAAAKSKHLEEKYGDFIRKSNPIQPADTLTALGENSAQSNGNRSANTLDLATMLKASQALSGEIRLDKLLSELMHNLIQNTGAEKGLLVLEKNQNWIIQVEGAADGTIEMLGSEKLQQSKRLPQTIINYVLRSKQPLVLGQAWLDGQFRNDAYVIEVKPQSIICAPIINQGRLSGAVYLENRLAADVFTPDRLQVVSILSSQAAISLENSFLYENLEEKVEDRTKELAKANQILSSTNIDLVNALKELRTLQAQMMQSEKMIALGQLISGIAHEVNTPLGAILASNENIVSLREKNLFVTLEGFTEFSEEERKVWSDFFYYGSKIPTFLNYSESKKKRQEIMSLMEQIDVKEKKILIENLIELDLPIQKVNDLLKSKSISRLEAIAENAMIFSGLFRSSLIIKEAALKAKRVITALKTYIYQDWENQSGNIDIPEQVETVLTLYYNTSKDHVKFSQNYAPDSRAWGVADQISQIWTNLISNSLQAMNYKGEISISSHIEGDFLTIDVEDNGPGIPAEVQPNIFDSFFTTKGKGMGSGLGLSICRKILEDNGGSIDFTSAPGRTVFTVKLLRAPRKEKSEIEIPS